MILYGVRQEIVPESVPKPVFTPFKSQFASRRLRSGHLFWRPVAIGLYEADRTMLLVIE